MRVNVFGPGGVGGYLAARLAASGRAEVSVVGRGAHLEAIRTGGLRLESPQGDVHVHPLATDEPDEVGPVDVVLFTVKGTDAAAAAAKLGPLVGPDTSVITLQNGIDSPRLVADVIGREAVFPGVAYIFSTVAEPGLIRHTAVSGRIVFGAREPSATDRASELGELLASAGVDNEVVDDVDVALWSKFVLICSTAGVTAPSRLPIGVLRMIEPTAALFRDLVEEGVAVGRAAGVALPSDIVDRTMEFITNVGDGAYSSLLYDLVNGKPMELDTLHGAIIRLADEFDVDVPATRTVYALLAPWAASNARGGRDVRHLDATLALGPGDRA